MCIFIENFDLIFFSRNYALLNLEIWQKRNILPKQFVSLTPLKLLNIISHNLIVKMDILCTCAYSKEILIWFFYLENMDLNGQKYIILSKLCETGLAGINANINDIEPVYISFWQWTSKCYTNVTIINNVYDDDFLHDCQSLMYGIGIHYVQHFQAMFERGVCKLARSFFHLWISWVTFDSSE